jgi:two-component sensor histidine kinase
LQIVDVVPNRFKPTDQILLETLARSAGVAIENATLYEQTRRDADLKTLLLREVNQRIASNLTSINSILNLKRSRVQSTNLSDYQAITEDVINQVQSLTTVYNMMSAAPAPTVSLSELTSRVINASLKVLSPQKYVSVNVEPTHVQLNAGQAHELALVINELVTNAVKHALPHVSSALEISVDVTQQGESIQLTFKDNGPGYPLHILNATTYSDHLGMELLHQVVRSGLNGQLNLSNDSGAKITIEFEQHTAGSVGA